jgi:exodeoxyribonuclease VIII
MKPGIYYDISFEDYLAIDAVNSSLLKDVAMRSCQHAQYNKTHPKESDALAKGKLFHTITLQPERFRSEFAIAPKCDRRTKAGKADWQTFLDQAGDKQAVSKEDYTEVFEMRKKVYEHPAAIQFVQNGKAEVTCVWVDKPTGLLCKARGDYEHRNFYTIVDLKSTKIASPGGFSREMRQYGYHIQAAFYTDGWKEITGENHDFVIVASEKTAPFCVGCYLVNEYTIEAGQKAYRRALDIYAEALKTGKFTGYSEDIEPIDIPDWALYDEGIRKG